MAAGRLLIPVRRRKDLVGHYRIDGGAVLASPNSADVGPLRQLAGDLAGLGAPRAKIVRNAFGPANVRIRRVRSITGAEAYRLGITTDGVEIEASTDAGAYYAVQTLRELLVAHGLNLPAREIDDKPDFARRGVYLDCSRGKVPKLDTLKALVERLAHWKINELQLYVENVFTFKRHPKIGRGYSPFTPAELLDLQDYCKSHHVRLVGSLASFGHMGKILCLDEYRHLGEMPGFQGLAGGTTLCPGDSGSIRLIEEMFEEFLPLFEAEDFNVCCDETWELGKGRSKRRADKVGVGRVYLDFLLKINKLCRKHGKRMNAWADIVLQHPDLLPDIPKDIVMLNWDYFVGGSRVPQTKDIAAAKLPLVVCPGTSSWRTHGSLLENAIGNVAEFAAAGRKYGAEGLLNTDWGDFNHRNLLGVSLHGFAHGAAHAWNGRGVDDENFTETFCRHVFGQSNNRLAATLRRLGSTNDTIVAPNTPYRSGRRLYFALVEPLDGPKGDQKSAMDGMWAPGLRKVISQLGDPGLWPALPASAERFEKLAMREFAIAAQMDCLAARRSLISLDLRQGKAVASSDLRNLAEQMHRLAGDFSKIWMARNKPSRLRDNLSLMRKVERQARRLAKD